jgi:hydroxymethylbilane synthase
MTDTRDDTLRLGARGSLLSRMQSGIVADLLERTHPGLKVELVLIKTTGDQIADRPLHAEGGKGLFTKELEQALLVGDIDFAVHSFKDVPVTMPLVDQANLITAAVPQREDPRDVLVCGTARALEELPQGARVGTGSLRRRAQLLDKRPDLRVELIRGNVDTRIKRCRAGDYDAILLAMAGLRRSGLFDDAYMSVIDVDGLLPAAGQGALCLQCRADDPRTRELLGALDHPDTAACVEAERELVRQLNGDCHSPIAAYATIGDADGGERSMTLKCAVAARDGQPPVLRAMNVGEPGRPKDVAGGAVMTLIQFGVERLLL